MTIFNRISNNLILLAIISILFLKIIFYILIKFNFISLSLGGGDADYYHNYALGNANILTSSWPAILNYLNNIGVYSREGISYFLFFLSSLIIPFLAIKLSNLNFKDYQKYYLYFFLICAIYPTLYLYSFDIYRDIFMLCIFLMGCLVVKQLVKTSNLIIFIFLIFLSILIGLFLVSLRPYLGYSFILSLFLWKIKFTKKRLILFGGVYFLILFLGNYIGIFENLTQYRAGFEEGENGSTLGLDFTNPIMFIPNFILSTLGQLFGLYITNPFAIILFFIEVIPFIFMLIYIVKNIKLADNFIRFLIIFFVLYASVWLIGNDNLGTAIRLRIYNYFVIYICFFYILSIKFSYLKSSKVSNK